MMRTQVGIVGAGPSGLLLAHLLGLHGVESVVLENRSREYVEQRVRAGVLEQGAVDVFRQAGLAGRIDAEGLIHHGIELRFSGKGHRIAMSELTGGRTITIYGQNRVVADLVEARLAAGGPLLYEVEDVAVHDLASDRPSISFTSGGADEVLECDVIAGCDGFHGVCRPAIPAGAITEYERVYPFAWLGILATVAPSTDELIYAHHPSGFALHSLRSPEVSRLYIQVPAGEDMAEWPDDRIWSELHTRLADRRRLDARRGADLRAGDRAAAQLRRRADALREALPGRRRRPHRPSDRREGAQPRGGGRDRPRHGARRLLRDGQRGGPRRLLGHLPAAGLAGPAVLVVDDLDAAPLPR